MFALIDFWSLFVQCVCFLIYFSVSYDFETNLKSFYFHICLFIPFICTLTHNRKKSLLMLSVLNILAPEQKHKHRHLTFYRHGLPLTIMLIEHMIYSSAFHPKQIFFNAVSYSLHLTQFLGNRLDLPSLSMFCRTQKCITPFTEEKNSHKWKTKAHSLMHCGGKSQMTKSPGVCMTFLLDHQISRPSAGKSGFHDLFHCLYLI